LLDRKSEPFDAVNVWPIAGALRLIAGAVLILRN
jgi:hypothetical protein